MGRIWIRIDCGYYIDYLVRMRSLLRQLGVCDIDCSTFDGGLLLSMDYGDGSNANADCSGEKGN